MLLDGYELPRSRRLGFVGKMRDFAIRSAANEAVEAKVTPDSTDPTPLWAVTWRARSAAWMV
ncbi:MAG: trifolitoxin immunity protein, partial [Devosia sp.]|nr:trifolitoxin immunity protein [Devosia sp.]